MTTNIEGGFRLTPGTDPFALLRNAQTVVEPIRERLVAAGIAEKAAHIVHRVDLTGEPAASGPLFAAANELADETLKGDWRGFRCRLGLSSDPATGRTHLLVLGHQDYKDAVSEMDGVEDYAYWSARDRPENISAAEWEKRRVSWNRVLPGAGNIGNNMAVWNIDSTVGRTRKAAKRDEFEKVERHLPDTDERSRALVRDRILKVLNEVEPLERTRTSEITRRREGAALLAATDDFAPVRSVVADLIHPTDWKTFGHGRASRLHPELGSVDQMVGMVLTNGCLAA